MNKVDKYQPVVIIGAARSGTKLLRDTLATHPDVASVPFDINFVWKYGNEKINHDELTPDMAFEKNSYFIRKYLQNYAGSVPLLIEKTVSNTIRVPFVDKILPEAKYIHIIRDGKDVVESVYRQWGTIPPKGYLLAKLKSFPFINGFQYGCNYFMDLARIKLTGKGKEDYVWGVKYPGYENDLKNCDTFEFCAHQWAYCVQRSLNDFSQIDKNRQLTIRYENFVVNPQEEIRKISRFLEISSFDHFDLSNIRKDNIGKSVRNISDEAWSKILPIIQPGLEALGYNGRLSI